VVRYSVGHVLGANNFSGVCATVLVVGRVFWSVRAF
jgi:hypothetical protein